MFEENQSPAPIAPQSVIPPSAPVATPVYAGRQVPSSNPFEPQRSKLKIVILILVGLIIVFGIVGAGYFYFKSKSLGVSFTSSLSNKAEDYYDANDILSRMSLTDEAKDLLAKQSFVAVDWGVQEDFVEAYKDLRSSDIPIFVTSDSVLHLYHIQFDETLKSIEEKEFFDDIWQISSQLNKRMQEIYGQVDNDQLKQAANKNQAYFSVVLNLLKAQSGSVEAVTESEDAASFGLMGSSKIETEKFSAEDFEKYKYETPGYIAESVNQELALIGAHEGYDRSPNFDYNEDYSQYVPRGHYTRSEKLQNYFRAFMYLGRMTFLLNGGDGFLVNKEIADSQTIQAAMIARELQNDPALIEKWNRIYQITAFYVGVSDDLTPFEYNESINKVFTGEFAYNSLTSGKLQELRVDLNQKESPAITGGAGQCSVVVDSEGGIIKNQEKCTDVAKGLRFMGQRFVPDSYIMEHLTLTNEKIGNYLGEKPAFTTQYPAGDVGIKGFPRGLEVFAVFGSERAKEIIAQEGDDNYANYATAFNELKTEVDQFTNEQWRQNAYWSWIYTLKALTTKYDDTYPAFMQSTAWQDKQANAVLASWAELRHDTILYAKQGYTELFGSSASGGNKPKPKPPVGYVEPVPEFYGRLVALTESTEEMLSKYEVLDEVSKKRLKKLNEIVTRLEKISEQELRNEELSEDDYDFIKYFGDEISAAVTDVDDAGIKTTLIADVHTYSDGASNLALEEGVGYIKKIIVSYELPDGRTLIGAGPIFSYYEFKQPMNNRLTDEAWRKMLKSENRPAPPAWNQSFKIE